MNQVEQIAARYARAKAALWGPPVRNVVRLPPGVVAQITLAPPQAPVDEPKTKAGKPRYYVCSAPPPSELPAHQGPLTFERIKLEVCFRNQVAMRDLVGRAQFAELAQARHEVWYLAWMHTRMATTKMGQLTGRRDHSTVFHGIRKHAERYGLPIGPRNYILQDAAE